MKKLLFLLLFSQICFAQDTIFLISGKPLVCKIVSATNKNVKYTVDNNDSLKFTISPKKIDSVILKSGFVINKDIFHSSHVHSKYSNSFNASLIDKTVKINHLISFNAFSFFNHKIQLNHTYFFNRKSFALTSTLIYNYSYRKNEFRNLNSYSTLYGVGLGLKVLNYFNSRNAIYFMPSIDYQKFWKEVHHAEVIGTRQSTYGTVYDYKYYYENVYNEAIIPSLYIGGLFFFTERIFISPVIGFGMPIELSSRKDIEFINQLHLNIGFKIK